MAAINSVFSARQIFRSSILLILCCAFYLTWWLLAFKPSGAIKGMKSGWLLFPAFAAGLTSIILAVKGIQSAPVHSTLFPDGSLLWGGITAYCVLAVVTRLCLKRPVTTELFLIIGWAVLASSEIDVLYGIGQLSYNWAVLFIIGAAAVTLAGLICYVLYNHLGKQAGYVDGTIPLLLVALAAAGIAAVAQIPRPLHF